MSVNRCEIEELLAVFRLHSDSTRLLILLRLFHDGEMHVGALCHILRKGEPAVSHQLAILRCAGLVTLRREGKFNYYRIVPERFEQVGDALSSQAPQQLPSVRFGDYVLRYEN